MLTHKKTPRVAKVNALIQQIVGEAIKPYIENLPGLITISKTETSGDLKWVKVWISIVDGDDDQTFNILKKNIYDIQGQLNRSLAMKIVPCIQFFLDTSPRYVQHINELLNKIHEEDGK